MNQACFWKTAFECTLECNWLFWLAPCYKHLWFQPGWSRKLLCLQAHPVVFLFRLHPPFIAVKNLGWSLFCNFPTLSKLADVIKCVFCVAYEQLHNITHSTRTCQCADSSWPLRRNGCFRETFAITRWDCQITYLAPQHLRYGLLACLLFCRGLTCWWFHTQILTQSAE